MSTCGQELTLRCDGGGVLMGDLLSKFLALAKAYCYDQDSAHLPIIHRCDHCSHGYVLHGWPLCRGGSPALAIHVSDSTANRRDPSVRHCLARRDYPGPAMAAYLSTAQCRLGDVTASLRPERCL